MRVLLYLTSLLVVLTSCNNDKSGDTADAPLYPYKIRIADVHPVQSLRHSPLGEPELNEEFTDSCVSDSAAIYSSILTLDAKLVTEYKLKGKVEPHMPAITIYGPDGMPIDTTAIKDWERISNILHDEEALTEIRKNVVGFNTTLMFDSPRQSKVVIEMIDKMF